MANNRILILFAHPLFERSRINKVLVSHIPDHENITFHDLYEEYPDFDIDIKREQELLSSHNIIIWHHPMYWYSCPPLMKQWIDMVLEFGWAYGKNGNALTNKMIFQMITVGGVKDNYCAEGRDRFTIPDLLEPFNQTARLCNMEYLPPYVVHGTHNMNLPKAKEYGVQYNRLLYYLAQNTIDPAEISDYFYMNEWFNSLTTSAYDN